MTNINYIYTHAHAFMCVFGGHLDYTLETAQWRPLGRELDLGFSLCAFLVIFEFPYSVF